MSLIYAEGFEHFHQSSTGLIVQPKTLVMTSVEPETITPLTHASTLSIHIRYDNYNVRSGVLGSGIEIGRKGGKSVSIGPRQAYSAEMPVNLLGMMVKKSRTLYVGFAFRKEICNGAFRMSISFARANNRTFSVNKENWLKGLTLVGGCLWLERGGYADLEWRFQDQSTYYSQLYHNRNILNGDWHYVEFGTTLYGNAGVENSIAWTEARIAGVSSRIDNIRTATPASVHESFFNAIIIKFHASGNRNTLLQMAVDDLYVCNDEGTVNNDFLGGIFVRPMKATHTGALHESYPVGATLTHEAVGPHFAGDETSLPNPLPTPEEDPYFEPWGNPTNSHLILPREGNRQNFRCTAVDFGGSNPTIHGVIADVVVDLPAFNIGRALLTPIKTSGELNHDYYPESSDMVFSEPQTRQLIFENPNADKPVDVSHPDWSSNAVNNSAYGFRVDPAVEQVALNERWNPALLRYPVVHDQTVIDVFGMESWSSRHWEEFINEPVDIDEISRWDWACPVDDALQVFDEGTMFKSMFLVGWSNIRNNDVLLVPEEFIREFLGVVCGTQVDTIARIEEELGSIDTSYHEWVEQLTTWLDPYDQVERAWGVGVADGFNVDVTDIFDGHLDVEEDVGITAQVRSNHELLEETLYAFSHSKDGIVLPIIEDGFGIVEDHHDGHWVEQFPENLIASVGILTRHWRFEIFWFVCIRWWEVDVVEQPLEWWERNPCEVKNDNILEAYKVFFGYGGFYDEVQSAFQTQWIHFGGDPSLDFDNVRWASFSDFIFDGHGNAIDMIDANGNSIIEAVV